MRKVDKLKQIEKANILAEQRFMESKGIVNDVDYRTEDLTMYYPDNDLKNITNKVNTILNDLRNSDGGGSSAAYTYYLTLSNFFKKLNSELGEINQRRMIDTDAEQKQRRKLGLDKPIGDSPNEFSNIDN